MSDESAAWEPTRWTIEVWSDPSADEEAGDIIHDACSALMAELIRQKVKHPAVFSTGKGGPRARAKYEEAKRQTHSRGGEMP